MSRFQINEGSLIPQMNGEKQVRVLRSFDIEVRTVKGGFVAVSDVSDVFELERTPAQAVHNYLYSLGEELMWFQEHKRSLSPSMLEYLAKLQHHLTLV